MAKTSSSKIPLITSKIFNPKGLESALKKEERKNGV